MKRLFYFLLMPLAFLACTREVEETPIYSQFAVRQDLIVAQVAGFQVNDSVKVDVVILVADDTAAWCRLKKEFNIRADEGVTSWMGNIDHPDKRVKRSVRPAWRAMAVHEDRTIALYRIDTEEQRQALLDYQMDKIEKLLSQ